MRLLQHALPGSLIVLLALSSPSLAQDRHIVDRAAIADTLDLAAANQESDRAAIRQAISRPEVRDMASHMGLDLERVSQSISTLEGPDLARAATAAGQVNDSLVGGASTLVISTTTIIIILLVVILLIVAIK